MMDRFLNSNKRNSADKESMSSTSGATVKKQNYRKYDVSYLEFGLVLRQQKLIVNRDHNVYCV
jgi:hypothetical protein